MKKELEIGNNIKEIFGRKRIGEIISILDDNNKDPTLECIEVDPKELKPKERSVGQFKKFKIKLSKVKIYVPISDLFKKEKLEVGKYISYKKGGKTIYGRLIGYLNNQEGLYPHSYDSGEYNGKDLLQCVEIDPGAGLYRRLDSDGTPRVFIANSEKCKIVKIIDTDEHGNPTTAIRLDIAPFFK